MTTSSRIHALLRVAVLLVTGCTIHTGHTIQPYGRDATKARDLEDLARGECLERQKQLPPYSFTTDGCSWWFDSTWKDCCVVHDRAYWCGGTFSERVDADRKLQDCVRERSGSRLMAVVMRAGVFLGGGQLLPTSFRWGYGWPYPCAGP